MSACLSVAPCEPHHGRHIPLCVIKIVRRSIRFNYTWMGGQEEKAQVVVVVVDVH